MENVTGVVSEVKIPEFSSNLGNVRLYGSNSDKSKSERLELDLEFDKEKSMLVVLGVEFGKEGNVINFQEVEFLTNDWHAVSKLADDTAQEVLRVLAGELFSAEFHDRTDAVESGCVKSLANFGEFFELLDLKQTEALQEFVKSIKVNLK